MTIFIAVVGALLLRISYVAFTETGHTTPITRSLDFNAFYCGAKTIGRGSDPYRWKAIMACQTEAIAEHHGRREAIAVAAPLPPYALFALNPLARLPFALASYIWALGLYVAFLASAIMLQRVSKVPSALVFLALFYSTFVTAIGLGQFGPLLVAFVVLNVMALRRNEGAAVAASAWGVAIEPHVGFATLLACFCYVPKARGWLAAGAALVLIATVAAPRYSVEYFTTVLPLHAISQLSDYKQFSLTTLVWTLGVPAKMALFFGAISFVVMIALGLVVAGRLRKRDPGYVALVPTAFSVIGGTYVHLAQIAVAVPLAIVLLGERRRTRWLALVALTLLALPIQTFLEWSGARHDFYDNVTTIARKSSKPIPDVRTDPIIEATYPDAEYEGAAVPGSGARRSLIVRLPTWLGLLFLFGLTVKVAFEGDPKRADPLLAPPTYVGETN